MRRSDDEGEEESVKGTRRKNREAFDVFPSGQMLSHILQTRLGDNCTVIINGRGSSGSWL